MKNGLPAAMRVVGGTDAAAPPAAKAKLTAPDTLSEQAQPYWDQYVDALADLDVLSDGDRNVLAILAESTATYWYCMGKVREADVLVNYGKNDYMTRNPYLTEANTALTQVLKLSGVLGLTPLSRASVRKT